MIDQVKEDLRANRRAGFLCIIFSLGLALWIYQSDLFAEFGPDVFIPFSFLPLLFIGGIWLALSSTRAPRVRIHVTNVDLVVQPDSRSADPVRFELAHLTLVAASQLNPKSRTKLTFYAGGPKICITMANLSHDVEGIVALISERLKVGGKTLYKKPRRVMSGYHETWDVIDLSRVSP